MKYCTLFIFSFFFVNAQQKDSITSKLKFTASAEYGQVIPTNFYLEPLKSLDYQATSFMILKQTDGSKLWQRKLKNPSYGIGILKVDFLKHREFGNPFAIFTTYSGNAKKWKTIDWNYWINFGISFNSNTYDTALYPNPSLSTSTNMYIGLGSSLNYHIGKFFDLGLGIMANHFSNGTLKTPNKGLNFIAPQISFTYQHKQEPKTKVLYESSEENHQQDSVELSYFFAKKNVFYQGEGRYTLNNPYDGFYYNIHGIEGLYMKQYSYLSSIGIGLGITYDEEYNRYMYVSNGKLYQAKRFSNNQFLYSIKPTYRIHIDQLKIDVALGYYPFKKQKQYNKYSLFQSVSLKYFVAENLYLSFGINAADFHKANYLEWKIGYTVWGKKYQ